MEFVVESGPDQGRVVLLPAGRGVFGANPHQAHVVLRDPAVAAQHLGVDVQPGGLVTVWPVAGFAWLDGVPVVGAVPVRPGSRVQIGNTTLMLRPSQPPGGQAIPPAPPGAPGGQAIPPVPPAGAPGAYPVLPAAPLDRGSRRRTGLVVATVAMVLIAVLLVAGVFALAGAGGAVASLLAAVLPAPLLVALVLAIDRYEPEPKRVLAVTFAYGATAAVLLAGIGNVLGFAFVAAILGPELGEFLTASVVAPVVEETVKGVAVLVVFWHLRDQFNGVVDAIVYSAMVGLGFAVTENVFYYAEAILEGRDVFAAVVVIRGVFSPFAHPLFTSMFGIGLALAGEAARYRVVPPMLGLAGAMFLHGLWNASTFFGAAFLLVYLVVFVPTFLALVVVAVLAVKREQRLLRMHLAEDVQTGLLTPEELHKLASVRLRRRAERESAREGGEAAKLRRRDFHHAATRLAFLRHRRRSGALHAPDEQQEARWVEEVRRRKAAAKGGP